MPTPRTRSVSTKVTEAEYQQFARLAGEQTISTWVRAVILKAIERDPIQVRLLAEILATRTILLNLHFATANGEECPVADMQRLIDRADSEKFEKAEQALAGRGDSTQAPRRTR